MIIWADNFQAYGNDEAVLSDGLYAEVSSTTYLNLVDDPDPSAPSESRAMLFGTSSVGTDNRLIRYALPAGPTTTVGTFCRFYMPDLPTEDAKALEMFSFRDISNNVLLILELQTSGALRIRHAEGGTILGTSTLPVITANTWNHVEIKVTFSNTVGATEVRVNSEVVAGLTLTGQDTIGTGSNLCAQVAIVQRADPTSDRQAYYFKDWVLWDDSGSQNNNFLGLLNVINLYPNSDVAVNWTPSTGTSAYQMVDEIDPDDADYISAPDTYPPAVVMGLTDLPADIVGVRGLVVVHRSRKTDGGDGNLQTAIRVGGLDDTGAVRPITTAFTYRYDVSELSPATGTAYTPTEVNEAALVIDRTL